MRGCSRNKNQEDMIYLSDIIVVIWNEFRMTRWYLITFLYDCIPGILSFLSAFCSIRYTHAKSFFCIYHSSSSLLVHSFFFPITWTNKLENDFFLENFIDISIYWITCHLFSHLFWAILQVLFYLSFPVSHLVLVMTTNLSKFFFFSQLFYYFRLTHYKFVSHLHIS